MKNKLRLPLLALGIAAASLTSCSRASYSFNNSAPAYLGAERVQPAAHAPVATAEAASVATTSASVEAAAAPAHQAKRARAKHSAVAKTTVAVVATASQATEQPASTDAKATNKAVKHRLFMTPKEAKAAGKSQLVALLLCFFLGGLGIHRFYLGYIGLGILELLTFGLFGILSLIDFIRIIIGSLKPKNGEYAKTL